MCRFCETVALVKRADRAIKAIGEGSSINAEAIKALLTELRDTIAVQHNEAALRRVAEEGISEIIKGVVAVDPDAEEQTHANPGSIN